MGYCTIFFFHVQSNAHFMIFYVQQVNICCLKRFFSSKEMFLQNDDLCVTMRNKINSGFMGYVSTIAHRILPEEEKQRKNLQRNESN